MQKAIKITAVVSGLLMTLIVAPVFVIPLVIDPNDYKEDIAYFFKQKMGRELVFEGDIGLFFFPGLGLELGHVKVGNARGFGKGAFASVESAKVKIKVLPFLLKQLEVETFSLRGLEVNLKRYKGGRTNWEDLLDVFGAGMGEGQKEVDWLQGTPLMLATTLSGIEINDAKVVWDDRQNGNYAVISGIDLHTDQVVLNESFYLTLAFNLNNRRPQVKGHVDLFVKMTLDTETQSVRMEKTTVATQLRGKSLPLGKAKGSLTADVSLDLARHSLKVANLNLDALGIGVKGYLGVRGLFDKPAFKGKLRVSRFSPRKLMKAMGKTPPETADSKALSNASADFLFDASNRVLNMKKLVLRLDDATIKGKTSIKNFDKPKISFDLVVDQFDMDRYLPPKPKGTVRKASQKGKIDAQLDALELRGKLRIGKLKVHNLRMRDVHTTVNAQRGNIHLSPFQASLLLEKSGKHAISSPLNVGLMGDLNVNELFHKPVMSGKLKVLRFSPRKLISAMGKTPPTTADPKALRKASADFEFSSSSHALHVKNLVLRLDDATIKGKTSIKNFAKPKISFDLTVDKFDVDRYLPPKGKRKRRPKKKYLLKRKVALKDKRGSPWEPLRALGLGGKLRIGKLDLYNLKMKDVRLTVAAKKGVIRLHPLKASLYKGTYSGDMIFDLSGKIPKISTKENLKKIQVGPLLKDFIGEKKISGTANVSVRITTKGLTNREFRRAMHGNVSFSVTNGRLRGLTIPIVTEDKRSIHDEGASKTVKKTNSIKFSVARGTVWIRKGVARNTDFDFLSPLMKLNGKGQADLASQHLDYLLYVQIPSMPIFPIRIHGPFSKPATKLEVGEMIKVTLGGLGKSLKETFKKSRDTAGDMGENVREMFQGMFH